MVTNRKTKILTNDQVKINVHKYFSIGRLIGVHVSCIANSIETISSLFIYLFYFFFTKRFHAYKNVYKQTLANRTKYKRAKNNKGSGFLGTQASKRVKVA